MVTAQLILVLTFTRLVRSRTFTLTLTLTPLPHLWWSWAACRGTGPAPGRSHPRSLAPTLASTRAGMCALPPSEWGVCVCACVYAVRVCCCSCMRWHHQPDILSWRCPWANTNSTGGHDYSESRHSGWECCGNVSLNSSSEYDTIVQNPSLISVLD